MDFLRHHQWCHLWKTLKITINYSSRVVYWHPKSISKAKSQDPLEKRRVMDLITTINIFAPPEPQHSWIRSKKCYVTNWLPKIRTWFFVHAHGLDKIEQVWVMHLLTSQTRWSLKLLESFQQEQYNVGWKCTSREVYLKITYKTFTGETLFSLLLELRLWPLIKVLLKMIIPQGEITMFYGQWLRI